MLNFSLAGTLFFLLATLLFLVSQIRAKFCKRSTFIFLEPKWIEYAKLMHDETLFIANSISELDGVKIVSFDLLFCCISALTKSLSTLECLISVEFLISVGHYNF